MPDPISSPRDRFALLRLLGDLQASPSGANVTHDALAAGASIVAVDDARMDAEFGASNQGTYDPDRNTVFLRSSLLEPAQREQGLQTLAHELFHVRDRSTDAHRALLEMLSARYAAFGPTAVRDEQVRYHASLVRESRAYVFQDQIRFELGIDAKSGFHRAIEDAPTSDAAYRTAWDELEQTLRRDRMIVQRDVEVVYMPGATSDDPV
jgi:hypothetical protein